MDTLTLEDIDRMVEEVILAPTDTKAKRAALLKLKGKVEDLIPSKEKTITSALTDKAIATYATMRRRGLPRHDAARILGLTPKLLAAAFHGVGLSPSLHQKLLRAESEAEAGFKMDMITALYDAATSGHWRAAKTLMEKVLPDEYGPRLALQGGLEPLTVDMCQDRAAQAIQALQALREKRDEKSR